MIFLDLLFFFLVLIFFLAVLQGTVFGVMDCSVLPSIFFCKISKATEAPCSLALAAAQTWPSGPRA